MNQGVPDPSGWSATSSSLGLGRWLRGSVRSRIAGEVMFRRERLRTEHAADDVRARFAQVMRQARDGRRVEQGDDRDVVAELLLEPVDQHGPLDRAAAQLEEVIMDADLVHAQHLAPEARQELLQGVPGAT